MPDTTIAVIDTPEFWTTLVLRGDEVMIPSSRVEFMVGWQRDKVRDYCKDHGWSLRVVATIPQAKRKRPAPRKAQRRVRRKK